MDRVAGAFGGKIPLHSSVSWGARSRAMDEMDPAELLHLKEEVLATREETTGLGEESI